MISAFHILLFAAVLGGAVIGYRVGYAVGDMFGAIVGVIVGLTVGWWVGRWPSILTFRSLDRDLSQSESSDLRSRLERDYFISHLIIAELVNRGEPVESFRNVVTAQLNSASSDVRKFGRANAETWFPDLLPK